MIKIIIVQKLIERYKARLATAEESLSSANKAVNEAPSAMQSGSDTTRYQMTGTANNIGNIVDVLIDSIKIMSQFQDIPCRIGKPGSVISLVRNGVEEHYFLIPDQAEGGEEIVVDGNIYCCINQRSPLGASLIGKIESDEFSFGIPGNASVLFIKRIQ